MCLGLYFQSNPSSPQKKHPFGCLYWRRDRDSSCLNIQTSVTPIFKFCFAKCNLLTKLTNLSSSGKKQYSIVFYPSALGTLGLEPFLSTKKHPFGCLYWRRDRDSNPRYALTRTIDFESTAFDHSAISPLAFFFIK